jgi:hypothetical protein
MSPSLLLALLLAAAPTPKKAKPAPPPPVAQPAPPQTPQPDPREAKAKEAKARGDAAMDAGRPADALAAYSEAAGLWPDPALLYNRARAYEKLRQYPQALELIEQFNREAPEELKAKVPKLAQLTFDIRQHTTRLLLDCAVKGAEVRLGDRVLGSTPLPAPMVLNAEDATLTIKAEGYFPWTRHVTMPPAGDLHLEVALTSQQTSGLLRLESPVQGALIAVDDAAPTTAPTEVVVPAGTHRLSVSHDGYHPATSSVVVVAGETRTLSLDLEPVSPFYKRWYFWTAVAVVVAGGVATGVALTTERGAHSGTLGQYSAGLTFP